MHLLTRTRRASWWRLALAALLSLHLGVAQATMPPATAAAMTDAPVASASAQALPAAQPPCHGAGAMAHHGTDAHDSAVPSTSSPDPSGQHPCCDMDGCHCAALLALPRIDLPLLTFERPATTSWIAAPARSHIPSRELRPPIA